MTLASRNDDIRRMIEKGFAVAEDNGYLIIRDVPYLNSDKVLCVGAFVTKLVFVDAERVQQDNHQVFFAGGPPHGLDGRPIPNLGDQPATLSLGAGSKDVFVQRQFSNKPRSGSGFADFFAKIESYTTIVSGPAMELHGATPYSFRSEDTSSESVFLYRDTLTSRAEIADLSARFGDDVVVVIGLGGTGSYITDLLVRTPVKEIRIFDADPYHVHNAFRSPGSVDGRDFERPKAELYQSRYATFRKGVVARAKFLDATCHEDVDGATFAFVCVDDGPSRAGIFDLLIARRIPFIDVGMNLSRRDGGLNGLLRVTYYSVDDAQRVRDKGFAPMVNPSRNEYDVHI